MEFLMPYQIYEEFCFPRLSLIPSYTLLFPPRLPDVIFGGIGINKGKALTQKHWCLESLKVRLEGALEKFIFQRGSIGTLFRQFVIVVVDVCLFFASFLSHCVLFLIPGFTAPASPSCSGRLLCYYIEQPDW